MMYDYTKIKYLYPHEKENLFTAITYDTSIHQIRNKAIFYLASYAGLRASEIGLIEETDFVSYNKEIYCKRIKRSNNNTLRIIDENVLAALEEYIEYKEKNQDSSPFLFSSQKGNPISRKTLATLMKHYCHIANIPTEKSHFHTLKHTRAVELAELGLDTKEIQYWLGHKSIKSTEIYFQFTSRQQEHLYQKIMYLSNSAIKQNSINMEFMQKNNLSCHY